METKIGGLHREVDPDILKSKKVEDVAQGARMKRQSQFQEVWKRFAKNKLAMFSLFIIILFSLVSILANRIAPFGIDEQILSNQFLTPSKDFIMGTDNFGRDIFSRILYGGRISLTVGFVSVSLSCFVGVVLGVVAGFYGGWVDNLIMRFMDILLAIPSMLLAIAVAATLGPGLFNLMIAIGVGHIPGYARIVRATILSIKEQEYIEAARAIGSNNLRIMLVEILPNSWSPIIVQATMSIAYAILAAAGLSFIGLGLNPPTPEWGAMLSAGRGFMRDYPHVVIYPGLMIMITVLSFNFLGDGLRDALDPRLKK